eukprot:7156585-Prymnesium_polylepis.1
MNFLDSHFNVAELVLPAAYMRCVIGAEEPAALRLIMAACLGALSFVLFSDGRSSSWIAVCAVLLAHFGSALLFRAPHRTSGGMLLVGAACAAALAAEAPVDEMVTAAVGAAA